MPRARTLRQLDRMHLFAYRNFMNGGGRWWWWEELFHAVDDALVAHSRYDPDREPHETCDGTEEYPPWYQTPEHYTGRVRGFRREEQGNGG